MPNLPFSISASLSKHLPKSRIAVATAAASDIRATLFRSPQLCPPTSPPCNTASHTFLAPSSARSITTQSNSNLCRKQLTARNTATMSTMPAQHGHSEACCNIPPIVSSGYEAKGTYEQIGGYKTYVTGPSGTTKGVVTIYDIFGYYPQTLQGADIVASYGATKYKVFIPDWFKGEPAPLEWFPPDTDEKQKKLSSFFQQNSPPSVASQVPGYVKALSEKYPEIKEWAILGFCWGGKVVSLVSASPENPFKAGVEAHPAMVDPKDAENIKIPLALLASKDENAGDVKKFEANLTGPKHVETFPDQIHGWMAARSDLSDERVKNEYKRGYETVLNFLNEHL
ncbi:alpha/beta-hydrolase [Xylaria sp. FL0043]|nr:alpha/beta-hydrolase [Xylaria sp. FL0043]